MHYLLALLSYDHAFQCYSQKGHNRTASDELSLDLTDVPQQLSCLAEIRRDPPRGWAGWMAQTFARYGQLRRISAS